VQAGAVFLRRAHDLPLQLQADTAFRSAQESSRGGMITCSGAGLRGSRSHCDSWQKASAPRIESFGGLCSPRSPPTNTLKPQHSTVRGDDKPCWFLPRLASSEALPSPGAGAGGRTHGYPAAAPKGTPGPVCVRWNPPNPKRHEHIAFLTWQPRMPKCFII